MKNKTVKKLTTIVATSAVIASSVVTPVLGAQLPDTKDNADGKNKVEQGKKDILASQQDKENDYEVAKQQLERFNMTRRCCLYFGDSISINQ